MTIETFQIPHATSVFVDRSQRCGVLRAITALPEHPTTSLEATAKREMTDALGHAAAMLGLRSHDVTWLRTPLH